MAYTSDLRLKNLLKDIHCLAQKKLEPFGINHRLELRIFDESSEDAKLFKEGGLSFTDPYTNMVLGSNDAGWIIDGKFPLVIVEGTFGTERGQFGDGQLNRFSHSASVALNGYIGVTFVPFVGESYSKDGTIPSDVKSKNIRIKKANIHTGFLTGALNISKTQKGKFLIIDAYDINKLCDLIVESTKNYFHIENNLQKLIESILTTMSETLGKKTYGERSNQVISSLYDTDKNILSEHSRLYTQNYLALTTSTKRDGHGLLGKNLIEIYSSSSGDYYAIFIRLTKDDLDKLSRRNSKEFQYLIKNPLVKVKCIDDLEFEDKSLEKEMRKIITANLFQNREKEIIKRIQYGINRGLIMIRKNP